MLIERLSQGDPLPEKKAEPDEALMTAAYVESKRSSCLKRKVGAVIASSNGDIITAAHNDVPESAMPCIEDPRFGWCARDVIQQSIAQEYKKCPTCGADIIISDRCKRCGQVIEKFLKKCPGCNNDLDLDYVCPGCNTNVFAKFLPGTDAAKTGKLLDICRALHAEENAILNLSKTGIKIPKDAVLYSTTFPCNLCANKIITVGIKTVVYAEPYTTKEAMKLFEEKGITLRRFEGVKSRAYFRFYS